MGTRKLSYHFPFLPSYKEINSVHTGLPNRREAGNEYRYGFNGMEKDDEVAGEGNSYTTEFRQYDSRIGRWLSRDNLIKPTYSPFISFRDNPIFFIDPRGDDDIFSARGRYLGQVGSGNDVRVVTSRVNFKQLKKMPEKVDHYTTSITDFTYFPSDKANRKVLLKITLHYGKAAGIDTGEDIIFVENKRKEDDFGTPLAAWFPDQFGTGGSFGIYYDSKTGKIDESLNNKWNIISVAVHENYHKEHKDDSERAKALNHVYAIIAQTEHSSWNKLDESFKQSSAYYSIKVLNDALKINGVTKAEIQTRINDLNQSKLGVDGGGDYLFYLDGWEVKVADMKGKKDVNVNTDKK